MVVPPCEIDDHAAVVGGVPGHVVTAAPHRQQNAFLPGKVHGGDDVRGMVGLDDQGRVAVDHPVPHFARLLIAGVAGEEQISF
jgi:hypothetical protein